VLRAFAAHPSPTVVVPHTRPASASRLTVPPSANTRFQPAACELADHPALVEAMNGCDVVVQCIGLSVEAFFRGVSFDAVDLATTRQLVAAAKDAGVSRVVYISSIGAAPDRRVGFFLPASFFRTKYRSEQVVRDSGLGWVILRPSFVLGADGRRTERLVSGAVGLAARGLDVAGRRELASTVRPIPAHALGAAVVRASTDPRTSRTIVTGAALLG